MKRSQALNALNEIGEDQESREELLTWLKQHFYDASLNTEYFINGLVVCKILDNMFPGIIDSSDKTRPTTLVGRIKMWQSINVEAFQQLNMRLTEGDILRIARGNQEAIEKVLRKIMKVDIKTGAAAAKVEEDQKSRDEYIAWLQKHLPDDNFYPKDLTNGLVVCKILHNMFPNIIDYTGRRSVTTLAGKIRLLQYINKEVLVYLNIHIPKVEILRIARGNRDSLERLLRNLMYVDLRMNVGDTTPEVDEDEESLAEMLDWLKKHFHDANLHPGNFTNGLVVAEILNNMFHGILDLTGRKREATLAERIKMWHYINDEALDHMNIGLSEGEILRLAICNRKSVERLLRKIMDFDFKMKIVETTSDVYYKTFNDDFYSNLEFLPIIYEEDEEEEEEEDVYMHQYEYEFEYEEEEGEECLMEISVGTISSDDSGENAQNCVVETFKKENPVQELIVRFESMSLQ